MVGSFRRRAVHGRQHPAAAARRSSIGVHPVWLMFALFAFGSLFGFVGVLLAVPVTAAIGVLVRFAVERYRLSRLYLEQGRAAARRSAALEHVRASRSCRWRCRTRRATGARISWPAPSNSAALRLIESWPDWPAPVVLLSGPAGSGKTHLAHIWAARAGATIVPAAATSSGLELTAPRARNAAVAVEDVTPRTPCRKRRCSISSTASRELGGSLLLTSREPRRRLAGRPARPAVAPAHWPRRRAWSARRRTAAPGAGEALRGPSACRRQAGDRLSCSSRMERSLSAARSPRRGAGPRGAGRRRPHHRPLAARSSVRRRHGGVCRSAIDCHHSDRRERMKCRGPGRRHE